MTGKEYLAFSSSICVCTVIVLSLPQVLRNDVLSHHATVNTVNSAAAELLESSPGDEASHLRDQLDQLNQSWESLLLKTQERQKLLEGALQQVLPFKRSFQ